MPVIEFCNVLQVLVDAGKRRITLDFVGHSVDRRSRRKKSQFWAAGQRDPHDGYNCLQGFGGQARRDKLTATARDKLRRGEISALVYVATKPSRMFQHIRPDENLHFLPITSTLPPNYSPITITSSDYPELVSNDAPVKTVEVGTVLVAYNWPTNSERYQRVNHFVQTFFAHIEDFQASHPKWHQFNVTSAVSGWTRFSPAAQWLKRAGLTPEESKTTVVHLDTKQRDALFKDFRREVLFRELAAYQEEHRQTIVAYDSQ